MFWVLEEDFRQNITISAQSMSSPQAHQAHQFCKMDRNSRRLGLPICKCGVRCILKTSCTDKNPSRRFAICGEEEGDGTRCSFFEWVDPEMCKRSVEVIPGLLRRIRAMEEENNAKKISLSRVEEKSVKLDKRFAALKLQNWKLKFCSICLGLLALCSWILCIVLTVRLLGCNDTGKELKKLP